MSMWFSLIFSYLTANEKMSSILKHVSWYCIWTVSLPIGTSSNAHSIQSISRTFTDCTTSDPPSTSMLPFAFLSFKNVSDWKQVWPLKKKSQNFLVSNMAYQYRVVLQSCLHQQMFSQHQIMKHKIKTNHWASFWLSMLITLTMIIFTYMSE